MTLKAGSTGSTGKHRNQTCRYTLSSYYCTRKPDYYRLNSRWSQRENFDVTKERKPRSCSTWFSHSGTSTVKKRNRSPYGPWPVFWYLRSPYGPWPVFWYLQTFCPQISEYWPRTIRATVPQQSEEEITVNQLLKKCGKIYGGHEWFVTTWKVGDLSWLDLIPAKGVLADVRVMTVFITN
jgi:hypothetical protein